MPKSRRSSRTGHAPHKDSSPPSEAPSATNVDDPRFVELVGELALSSERFRTLWARHDIRDLDGGTTTVNHPAVGELRLHRDKLPVDNLILVLYYADQGSASEEKLRLLASHAQNAVGIPTPPNSPTAVSATRFAGQCERNADRGRSSCTAYRRRKSPAPQADSGRTAISGPGPGVRGR
uniref:MmyB family transcriptional regulator n=1 Tax=Nocardia acidivorans TaxID=404580 RepID=UPI0035A25165